MPTLNCGISIAEDSDFSIHNLPFGIFSTKGTEPRIGIAIGDQILDLSALGTLGAFEELSLPLGILKSTYLNDFIALGKDTTNAVRRLVQEWLNDAESVIAVHPEALIAQAEATMHLPIKVGDYTDFYSSIEHATNVGKMFRDPENALLPNWRHLPVGYHGRASSIIPSGQAIHRPKGQVKPNDAAAPLYQASGRLDFELEMAFVIGKSSQLGDSIKLGEAQDYIFGLALFNDWSARDIQKWEYIPLGPFLGKSFASSMSPWIVSLEALAPFKVQGPVQDPAVLPYLERGGMEQNYDIDLQVSIQAENQEETVVCSSNFKYMYWSMAQQLAHHTVNGCNVNVGDVMASGTISGPTEDSFGSMLELSWSGSKPVPLKDGSTRVFLQDGDTVIMRGSASNAEKRVGFGSLSTKILPAK